MAAPDTVPAAVILLTGKNGQLGYELRRSLATIGHVVAHDRSDCDLGSPHELRQVVRELKPHIIVNAAAYTDVDLAERESLLAHAVNAEAPEILAQEARRLGSLLIHYSSDYVLDGCQDAPYREDATPNPLSAYGRTKLAGEFAIAASGCSYLIFRSSWMFGIHGNNFLKTILKLAGERETLDVVNDQCGAPTPADLVADTTAAILKKIGARLDPAESLGGIYHLTAAGETTWCDYARRIVTRFGQNGARLKLTAEQIHGIASAAYPSPAKRPLNCRLDTAKLRTTFGLDLPDWKIGVERIIKTLI